MTSERDKLLEPVWDDSVYRHGLACDAMTAPWEHKKPLTESQMQSILSLIIKDPKPEPEKPKTPKQAESDFFFK